MKPYKNRLPLMIAASIVLCVIVTILSVIIINSADASMMQDKIDENRHSMQQAAARVEKSFGTKTEFIAAAAASLSGAEKDFDQLAAKKSSKLKKLEKSGSFEKILLSDPDGNAVDYEGTSYSVGSLSFFRKAAGRLVISESGAPFCLALTASIRRSPIPPVAARESTTSILRPSNASSISSAAERAEE